MILRNAMLRALLFLPIAMLTFAEENGGGGERGPYDTLGPWKIANTLIFVALFGYFIYKKAPAFFNARSADIQKAIREATGLKMDADLRYSEMDRKMATLSDEVRKIREQSVIEMEQEHRRREKETEEAIRRIQANADAQVQAFRQAATRRLRDQTADLALDLAAKRLAERAHDPLPEDSLHEFIHLVERGKN